LGPVFEEALKPLIDHGCLQIIYGGTESGALAVSHPLADEIHITGAIGTHDHIVWGPHGEDRDRRIRDDQPLIEKRITSELGNVTPWIVVPGEYSSRQLAFQTENVAVSVVNNVAFNCVSTRVLVTWKQWPQRISFLDRIDAEFARIPRRVSYYPGAIDRFRRLTGADPVSDQPAHLPWTLLRGVNPDERPELLEEESFVCVLAEVALDAATPEEFLRKAVEFVNRRLFGTLCAALTLPLRFRQRSSSEQLLQSCLSELQYGTVAINHWPGIMFALMSPPWGGYPGSSLRDVQSGIGWSHNTLMLDGVLKTVMEGPLVMFPKPAWFPSHPRAEQVAWSFFQLYQNPSWFALTRLAYASLRG
ncbi:MAG: hypothetical protein KDA96_03980, partial [Planctomycetaceae bacterium]|nr:hypothetical protein [Planctomycetaceae bacterium]